MNQDLLTFVDPNEGPQDPSPSVENPTELRARLQAAWDAMKSGKPAERSAALETLQYIADNERTDMEAAVLACLPLFDYYLFTEHNYNRAKYYSDLLHTLGDDCRAAWTNFLYLYCDGIEKNKEKMYDCLLSILQNPDIQVLLAVDNCPYVDELRNSNNEYWGAPFCIAKRVSLDPRVEPLIREEPPSRPSLF